MITLLKFLKENFAYISIGSILLFSLLVIFSILEIDFKKVIDNIYSKKYNKIVIVESLDKDEKKNDKNDLPNESFDATFCRKHNDDHVKLNKTCNDFNKEGCNSTGCCVWLKHDKGEECVVGNIHGPFFHGTEEEPINRHHHIYKGECIPGAEKCP